MPIEYFEIGDQALEERMIRSGHEEPVGDTHGVSSRCNNLKLLQWFQGALTLQVHVKKDAYASV